MSRRYVAAVILVSFAMLGCGSDSISPLEADSRQPTAFAKSRVTSLAGVLLPIRAAAINNFGTVVGSVEIAGTQHAAVLEPTGQLAVLPGLGGIHSSAADVNDHGVIVGSAETPGGQLHAVMWRDGIVEDLGTLGGENSWAAAINSSGQIAGTSDRASRLASAFLWTKGQMLELGALPPVATFSWGAGLNDRGDVVGWSSGGGVTQDPTLWKDGEIIDLGSLAFEGGAGAINKKGQIVGGTFPDRQNSGAATLWDAGEIIDLGYLIHPCEPKYSVGCDYYSSAVSINKHGQIVGGHGLLGGYLWDNGALVVLPTVPGASPFSGPADINDRGDIVGRSGELWSQRIPAGLAVYGNLLATEPPGRRGSGIQDSRPWSTSYCAARGRVRVPVTDLDEIANCPSM